MHDPHSDLDPSSLDPLQVAQDDRSTPTAAGDAATPRYRLPLYRVELVRERSIRSNVQRIDGPADVAMLFSLVHPNADREYLLVLCLDAKNRVRCINTVSIGDLTSSIVNPREVFKPAIVASAASIVLVHNHPSGDPTASAEDVSVTKRIAEAGRLVAIELLDHIIVGDGCYESMKQRGLL